jgi:hypothetical protein
MPWIPNCRFHLSQKQKDYGFVQESSHFLKAWKYVGKIIQPYVALDRSIIILIKQITYKYNVLRHEPLWRETSQTS